MTALVVAVSLAVVASWDTDACPALPAAVLLHASPASDLEPRWTGCFDRPRHTVPHPGLVTPLQVRGAVATFEIETGRRGRRFAHSLGAALALSGNHSRAVAKLTTTADRSRPGALSDLAAAHLVASQAGRRATNLILSLDYASGAVAREPRHLPARFNRALALEGLHLRHEAIGEWRRYLELDPSSAWAEEARRRLVGLEGQDESAAQAFDRELASGSPEVALLARLCADAAQVCRQYLEEVVLDAWAGAWTAGRTTAATSAKSTARVLAEALRVRGDILDADVIRHLDASAADPARLRELAAGFQAYAAARTAFENDGESIPRFREAELRLTRAESPLAGWARANRVYAEFNTYSGERLAMVAPELREWTGAAVARGYMALAGRLAYLEALTFVNRAEYTTAEPLMLSSLEWLQQTRERDHLSATYVLLAGARHRLGDSDAGWTALHEALACLPDIVSPRRKYTILLAVSNWMRQRERDHAAIAVLSSARQTAEQTGQGLRVAESSLNRAIAFAHVGQFAAARADLDMARPDAARNGQWGRGERARSEFAAAVAEVEQSRRPDLAVAAATDALAFFNGRAAAQREASLYLIRGRAHVAAGNDEAAASDFAAGIGAYQRYRAGLTSAQQRVLSQAVIWDLYEEQLSLAASQSPDVAFTIAEQGRARTLGESLGPAQREPSSLADLQRNIRGGARVIYFAVLPHRVLIWVISADAATFRQVAIDRTQLEGAVTSFVSALEEDAPSREWRTLAEQLGDWLLGPIRHLLPRGAPLAIIPDGVLHRLPFAAVVDPRSRTYLAEGQPLAMAPSATVLAHLLAQRSAGTPATLFAVADPAIDRRDVAALPGAEREARDIARLYSQSSIVSRDDATRAAFLTGAVTADVVHFAGHVMANPEYPLLSRLEFAPEPGRSDSGILDAEEIGRTRFHDTRLVVLAACTTAGGSLHRGEGVLSLARPFLGAGVRSVIATLWDIDDAASAIFLKRFHEAYVRTGNAGDALRMAQASTISTLSPATWAAFVLIGSPVHSATPH